MPEGCRSYSIPPLPSCVPSLPLSSAHVRTPPPPPCPNHTHTQVDGVYAASAALSGSIAAMQPPLEALGDAAGRLVPAVSRALGPQGAELAAALTTLDGLDFSQLKNASAALNRTVLPAIRDSIQPVGALCCAVSCAACAARLQLMRCRAWPQVQSSMQGDGAGMHCLQGLIHLRGVLCGCCRRLRICTTGSPPR